MARHKHPEQTVEKILEVSLKLFMEKRYDKTTIQDIIDAVGMSKCIIYCYFKSKDQILPGITNLQHKIWNFGGLIVKSTLIFVKSTRLESASDDIIIAEG